MAGMRSQTDGCLERPAVPPTELHRLLGYPPGRAPDARVSSLAARAEDWYERHGRPWACIRFLEIEKILQGAVRLRGGRSLSSPELAWSLRRAHADQVAVAAVSAGPEACREAARLWAEDRPDESFVLDAFCSAIAEQLIARAGVRISAEAGAAGRACTPHRSPGYGRWPLSDQAVLKELLEEGRQGELPGPLEVLPSGMLRPQKSMFAVFGVTPHRDLAPGWLDSVPCSNCDWNPCAFRRTAFTGPGPAARVPEETDFRQTEAGLPTDRSFDYAFSNQALERWVVEHLDLKRDEDGVRAVFRFHGTTCSNLGMPLLLRYEVELAGPPEGYRIRSAKCRPDANDSGLQAMCSYLEDAEGLMASIQSEHPLEGCPLDMALEWNPQISPSGCLCKGSDRNHKWRIVLQTIHYALRGRR